MLRRDVIKMVVEGKKPPYVPWSLTWSNEIRDKLAEHFSADEPQEAYGDHITWMGNDFDDFYFTDIGNNCSRDPFGVVWQDTHGNNLGAVKGGVLSEASLKGYEFPDSYNPLIYADMPRQIAESNGRLRLFKLPFLLFLRGCYMRGMSDFLMDFYDNPDFVHELFGRIIDYEIAQIEVACREYDIDAIYMGDDWGQQTGIMVGPVIWREFIKPHIKRLYGAVRKAGKIVYIHSCGAVQEILPDLIEIGVDVYNPFQPEVMDIEKTFGQHAGKLTFHGGLSNQSVLPFGTVDEVRVSTKKLLEMGGEGSYIFSVSNCVTGNTPMENVLEVLNILQEQPGYIL